MVEVDAEHAGQRLDNYLLRLCKGVPKTHIYKAIRGGEVRVNKGRIQADYRVAEGDIVRIPPLRLPDPGAPKPVPAAEFPVVYEDDAMLVVDKPAGVAVHGGSGVSFGVIEQLRAARPQAKFLELVHRLDRETSGLLMVAKKRNALLALHAMLREGKGEKHYLALVEGDWVNDRQHIKLSLSKWTTQSGERRVRWIGRPTCAYYRQPEAAFRWLQPGGCGVAHGARTRSGSTWLPAGFPSWATTNMATTRSGRSFRVRGSGACFCMRIA